MTSLREVKGRRSRLGSEGWCWMNSGEEDGRSGSRLAEDLSRLYPSAGRVPLEVDEEIARAAWEHFEGFKRRRRIRRWGLIGLIAAGVIVVIWGSQEFSRLRRASERQAAPVVSTQP